MKFPSPAKCTNGELVELFSEIAIEQADALTLGQTSKFNRLFGLMESVEAELKGRPGDQRSRLTELYSHQGTQVRLSAALATLAVEPERARNLLQSIADSQDYPAAAEARLTLDDLTDGRFVPA